MSNPEGRIVRVKAAELPGRLHDNDWVPAGKIQVLAWLALGAPIGRRRVRFGKASGQEVFNEFLAMFRSLNPLPGA